MFELLTARGKIFVKWYYYKGSLAKDGFTSRASWWSSHGDWAKWTKHFVDNIYNCNSFIKHSCILIKISLNFVPKDLIGNTSASVQGWGWLSLFPLFRYFPNFSSLSKHNLTVKYIVFIFDRCHRSSAAVTPVKYECDSRNITCTFARSKITLTEKLTNGALVTPTPDNGLAPDRWHYI